MADQENRTREDMAANVLSVGLTHYQRADGLLKLWHALTPREQQVASLICLGYTNRQMAARLGLSIETVKTHIKYLLLKFSIHSKTDLRLLFSSWDFSEWDR